MTTKSKNKGYSKDIASVIEVLSELREVAKDKTMQFLRPELEQILKDKIQVITTNIKDTILEPIKLKRALDEGDIKLIQSVLQQGVNINSKCIEGKTPLRYVLEDIFKNKSVGTKLKILIDKGAYLGVRDEEGYTPLTLAINKGKLEVVNILIEGGADIDICDGRWKSPIEMAIEKKDMGLVKLLIQKGASLNRVNINNETPLEIAKKMKQKEIVKVLKVALKEQRKEIPKLRKLRRKQIEELRANKDKIKVKTQNLNEVRNNAKRLQKSYQMAQMNKSKLKKLNIKEIADLRKHKERIQVKREDVIDLRKDKTRNLS